MSFSVVFLLSLSTANVGCGDVTKAIDAAIQSIDSPEALWVLSPMASPAVIQPFLRVAREGDSQEGMVFYSAVGFTRQQAALRALLNERATSARIETIFSRGYDGTADTAKQLVPSFSGQDIGYAIGLLALGHAKHIRLLEVTLLWGATEQRRFVADALSRMKQYRPRKLLEKAYEDSDPVVRLVAARAHYPRSSQARDILLELVDDEKDPQVRKDAAEILVGGGYRVPSRRLEKFPKPYRTSAFVALAERGGRNLIREYLGSRDDYLRTGALGASALLNYPSRSLVTKKTRRLASVLSARLEGELRMWSVLRRYTSVDSLVSLSAPQIEGAVDVLYAYSFGRRGFGISSKLDSLAGVIRDWLDGGILSATHEAKALEAVLRLDMVSALIPGRARLAGADGPALKVAFDAIGRAGYPKDAPPLLILSQRVSEGSAVSALKAAHAVCSR